MLESATSTGLDDAAMQCQETRASNTHAPGGSFEVHRRRTSEESRICGTRTQLNPGSD